MENKITKLLYHSFVYSAAITVAFFIFGYITGVQEPKLSLSRFLVILLFSAIISGAEFLFMIPKVPKAVCYIIHYAALFIAFLIVFIIINSSGITSSFVFAAVVIFTIIYAVITVAVFLLTKFVFKDNKKNEIADGKKTDEEKKYTPKFGG